MCEPERQDPPAVSLSHSLLRWDYSICVTSQDSGSRGDRIKMTRQLLWIDDHYPGTRDGDVVLTDDDRADDTALYLGSTASV